MLIVVLLFGYIVVLCYDMLRYVMFCYVKLCYVMFVPLRDAPMTRWPEAFSRVVPEGDALAYDFRV